MPLFSVVVPAFNAGSTLRETLDSIESQTFTDWELVLVDDGSTDDTRAIAQAFAASDPRVRVISQANRGSAGAYNTGAAAATGEFITICGADDLLLPEHLSVMAELVAAHPECDIFSSNGYRLFPDGSRQIRYEAGHWKAQGPWTLEQVITGCFFSVGATYRRGVFDMIGGYRDLYGEDWDFWLRAMARGARHCCTPVASAVHRRSDVQKSADGAKVATSDLQILTDLTESGLLAEPERDAAAAAIALRRIRLRSYGLTAADRAANEADRHAREIRKVLQKRIGKRRANAAMAAGRKVSWLIKPVRIAAGHVILAVRRVLRRG